MRNRWSSVWCKFVVIVIGLPGIAGGGAVSQAAGRGVAVRVVYLGSHGFLVRTPGHGVLVDALYRQRGLPPATARMRLHKALSPFDRVDLVLVTTTRTDTFEPEAVAQYLENNPNAWFVSTPAALRGLRFVFTTRGGVSERMRGFLPEPGQFYSGELGGVKLEVLRARTDSAALAFCVHMEDAKILLADGLEVKDERIKSALQKLGAVDGAVLGSAPDPRSTLQFLRQWLKVRWVALAHSGGTPGSRNPGVVVFTQPFQEATFPLTKNR